MSALEHAILGLRFVGLNSFANPIERDPGDRMNWLSAESALSAAWTIAYGLGAWHIAQACNEVTILLVRALDELNRAADERGLG